MRKNAVLMACWQVSMSLGTSASVRPRVGMASSTSTWMVPVGGVGINAPVALAPQHPDQTSLWSPQGPSRPGLYLSDRHDHTAAPERTVLCQRHPQRGALSPLRTYPRAPSQAARIPLRPPRRWRPLGVLGAGGRLGTSPLPFSLRPRPPPWAAGAGSGAGGHRGAREAAALAVRPGCAHSEPPSAQEVPLKPPGLCACERWVPVSSSGKRAHYHSPPGPWLRLSVQPFLSPSP